MKKILTRSIRFYQRNISANTPPSCRYHPTCSSYAIQAIEKHGALKGSVMGAARIIRCNPFVEGGVDEVPDYFTIFRNPENVDDFYIPNHLVPIDNKAMENLNQLLEQYGDQLKVSKKLPASLETLREIVELSKLTTNEIETEFSKEEIEFLEDIEILKDLNSSNYEYFTLLDTEKNKKYLEGVEEFDPEVSFGAEYPLIVLEKTGIWYTNMQKLAQKFLIERGVTEEDLENKTYHLWLVLNAIDQYTE